MSNIRPTRPTKPKTTPDRTWFCRKAVGVGVAEAEWLVMIVDVWVRVCCATDVTTAGGEDSEVVEVEVDEVVDEVVEADVLVTERLAAISKWN